MIIKPHTIKYLLIFLTFLFGLYSCRETNKYPEIRKMGYEYFPIKTGAWIEYEVEHIKIDAPSQVFDTIRYKLREYITEKLPDSITGQRFKIERFILKKDSWDIKDVWWVEKSKTNVVVNEENILKVKQVYPLESRSEWNGNSLNTLEKEQYKVIGLDLKDTIKTKLFDSVLTVEQKNFESLFEKKYKAEKYAKNIGMVYSKFIQIESQSSSTYQIDISKPIMTRITKGEIITIYYASHNKK
ncbi:MAG: hypothetical protein SNJ71_04095 [Bacteroidales bacterium]